MCWIGGYSAPDVLKVRLVEERGRKDAYINTMVFGEVGVIGGGGNSGFQALNLVAQFGAKRVILIGYDMQGSHWYGKNRWVMAGNPNDEAFRRWRQYLADAVPALKARGVEVINANPYSALECFPKMTLEQALA